MATEGIPIAVWQCAGVDPAEVLHVELVPFGDGTGAASGQVQLMTAAVRGAGSVRMVRKTFSRLTSGPHAEASQRADHWAYWRRELTAYQSGVLPTGPGLRAPQLYGAVDDVLYLEYVGERQPNPAVAAMALGRWHAVDDTAEHRWLARHQLAQRLAVSNLDWTTVDHDPRIREVWDQRRTYLTDLDMLPWSIAHGDFSTGNLRVHGGDLVVLDWATLGVSPVGFDVAHLALATLDDSLLPSYLDGLEGRYDANAVRLGYRVAVSLVGASRAHWMASRSLPLPPDYIDFIRTHAP